MSYTPPLGDQVSPAFSGAQYVAPGGGGLLADFGEGAARSAEISVHLGVSSVVAAWHGASASVSVSLPYGLTFPTFVGTNTTLTPVLSPVVSVGASTGVSASANTSIALSAGVGVFFGFSGRVTGVLNPAAAFDATQAVTSTLNVQNLLRTDAHLLVGNAGAVSARLRLAPLITGYLINVSHANPQVRLNAQWVAKHGVRSALSTHLRPDCISQATFTPALNTTLSVKLALVGTLFAHHPTRTPLPCIYVYQRPHVLTVYHYVPR